MIDVTKTANGYEFRHTDGVVIGNEGSGHTQAFLANGNLPLRVGGWWFSWNGEECTAEHAKSYRGGSNGRVAMAERGGQWLATQDGVDLVDVVEESSWSWFPRGQCRLGQSHGHAGYVYQIEELGGGLQSRRVVAFNQNGNVIDDWTLEPGKLSYNGKWHELIFSHDGNKGWWYMRPPTPEDHPSSPWMFRGIDDMNWSSFMVSHPAFDGYAMLCGSGGNIVSSSKIGETVESVEYNYGHGQIAGDWCVSSELAPKKKAGTGIHWDRAVDVWTFPELARRYTIEDLAPPPISSISEMHKWYRSEIYWRACPSLNVQHTQVAYRQVEAGPEGAVPYVVLRNLTPPDSCEPRLAKVLKQIEELADGADALADRLRKLATA